MSQYAGLDNNSNNEVVEDDDTDPESHSADEGNILATMTHDIDKMYKILKKRDFISIRGHCKNHHHLKQVNFDGNTGRKQLPR